MKTLLLSLFTCLFLTSSFAGHIRLTDTSNVWNVNHDIYDFPVISKKYQLYFSGDTVINGLSYQIMKATLYGSPATDYPAKFFREDTVQKKVWCIIQTYTDSSEHLIYNGNWQVNDTIKWKVRSVNSNKSYMTGKDSILINGDWHLKFHFRTVGNSSPEFDIIEGVGATSGPGYPAQPYVFEDSWQLKCFANNGIHPLINPKVGPYNFDNYISCTVSVTEQAKNMAAILVHPNPVADELIIGSKPELTGALITLSGMTGVKITERQMGNNDIRINTAALSPGIYFISVKNANASQVIKVEIRH